MTAEQQLRPPKQFPDRWRLARAGIVNVWYYLENEFDVSGGRMILRGTNGSGKSRALEMLLPFLLDADRRKMDATGSGRVSLDELMRTGADEQTNRTGYVWLELHCPDGHLTVGALIRHSRTSDRTQVWYFTTPLRVGHELALLSERREPLTREALAEVIGAERVTESAETHRERIRTEVFGLGGDAGRDRYLGLLQLLHTLRSPDVGNRIDEGRLPQILSDSLPPLGEQTLNRAGEQLDGLTATREAQQHLEASREHVVGFLRVYRRYAAVTLLDTAQATVHSTEELAGAERSAATKARAVEELRADFAAKQATEQTLRAQVDELQNAINGITGRAIFKAADDLIQRDRVVATLASATDEILRAAQRERDSHARTVTEADERCTDVCVTADRAADVLAAARRALQDADLADAALPGEIRTVVRGGEPQMTIVRTHRDGDPLPSSAARPRTVELWPADLPAIEPGVLAVVDATNRRTELSELRLAEVHRLTRVEQEVREIEADASRTEERAEADESQAAIDAQSRDGRAVDLSVAWRAWIADPVTRELLGEQDWATDAVAGPVLLDADSVTEEGVVDLDALAGTPVRVARPARERIVTTRAELDAAEHLDSAGRTELVAEGEALRRAQDPRPADPPWLSDQRRGVPFWRCVDFADGLAASDRGGLEGALLAAGFLTASVEADASLRADDGSVLLSAGTDYPTPRGRRLTSALRPDPAGDAPVELVLRVLEGIGLDDGSAVSVGVDGSWRNGPLRGRHVVPAARHIGAAARAEARRARLDVIENELAELAERAAHRDARRRELDERNRRLDAHLAAAPRTSELHAARRVAQASAHRAVTSAAVATAALARARESRSRWVQQLDAHRTVCGHHGLPTGADGLATIVQAARQAGQHCEALLESVRQLADRVILHGRGLTRAEEAAGRRDEVETRADEQWREWSDLAAEVAALHEAIALDVQEARDELARSVEAHRSARTGAERVLREVNALGPSLGTAEEQAKQSVAEVERCRTAMVAAGARFNHRLTMPGLATAATDQLLDTIDRPELVASVRAATDTVLVAVARPGRPADANAVLRAFQVFDREVSGQLDILHTVDDGVALVTVVGLGADRTVAGAARTLTERVEAGRSALSDREREVFTTFVLGGVAEELRRRINQASELVSAMNASLRSIRTSNGIGVKLSWRLTDDTAGLHRIAELVATADVVRSTAQNDELTDLLQRRVEEFYAADPSSGYTSHLADALDYRRWHEVEATILGPDPGQQRRLTKRAKLSQGETRFVSYVTLFAAADGYLSGLSGSGRQLRLILLDDAFAKVDDPTIAELMGLLVRLDLDFVMTGHALWGCFPEVPQLDVYEVRRQEGTSAVTTHVHWDGHSRHLRSTM